ncbi:hypothetical protein JKG47_01145 [Acidithiobacillus sp. MC6.1]|nr:hypothetical protein [Acidithiobacillus sp. MC6.1]
MANPLTGNLPVIVRPTELTGHMGDHWMTIERKTWKCSAGNFRAGLPVFWRTEGKLLVVDLKTDDFMGILLFVFLLALIVSFDYDYEPPVWVLWACWAFGVFALGWVIFWLAAIVKYIARLGSQS